MSLLNVIKSALAGSLRLSMIGLARGPHITRYYMYRRLTQFKQTPASGAKVLCVSHSNTLCGVLGLDGVEVTEANYPEANILSLPFVQNTFDYVVSDQVLEHIEGDPQTAIDESLRVLKPGGLAIHTTCFMNPIHAAPGDYWRFTPEALRLLCKSFSQIVEVGGWGNLFAFGVTTIGMRGDKIPEATWHPLHKIAMRNSSDFPIVTWIIAKK